MRRFIWLCFSLFLTLMSCKNRNANSNAFIRIGFQKSGAFPYMRDKKVLEKEFSGTKIQIKWVEFPSGPAIMEALNAGDIDICTTGAIPPIFAQSAGIKFYYVAHEPVSPSSASIIVPDKSPIKTIRDLKGKRVAVVKGSTGHYILLEALRQAGLKFSDIIPVYLQPADATAALNQGSIDAWSIWEPYVSAGELLHHCRILKTDILPNIEFYLASEAFVKQRPHLLKKTLNGIAIADSAINKDPAGFARVIAQLTGLPDNVSLQSVKRRNYGLQYMDGQVIARQKEAIEAFYTSGLIPSRLNINPVVWHP